MDLFEKTADACGWVRSQWPVRMIPLLTGEAQVVAQPSMVNLLQAQDRQTRLYNRGTRLRQFTPGDKVLVLLPT